MPTFEKFKYEDIIRILKETRSIQETSTKLGCSTTTVHASKIKYNKLNDDKIILKRGGFNREIPIPKSIDDLPPVAQRIARYMKRNFTATYAEIAEICESSVVYVRYVEKKIKTLKLK